MGDKDGVHVLLVSFAAQGHINPLLKLGNRLVSKGLHVTLATTEILRQRMLDSKITTKEKNSQIHLEFFSDGMSLDFDRKNNIDYFLEQLEKFGPKNLSSLIETLSVNEGRKFSCIVNNPFVPWVADVAQEHGIPCAMFWIQPCSLYSIYDRFYNNLNQFPTVTNPDKPVDLPGLPLLEKDDLPSFVLPSNPFGGFPKLFSKLFRELEKVNWVLGNSFYELEKDAIESMENLHPIRPIGPLVPSILLGKDLPSDSRMDMWKAEEACINWLDKKPPSSVIYVSFGSIVVLSSKQMENIAWGLKNSKRPFLWAAKPPEHPSSDGSGELPTGFLKETEEQGLVVSWCPQSKVLLHEAVACFVTHCGWNSTLETICTGVPVIAFPQWTDQPTNAKLLVDVFEMGVRVRADEDGMVSKGEVERCIGEVTEGPKAAELRKKAVEWKEAARAAVADGSSDRNIQLFVDDVRCKAMKEL
ncbi:UDP-glycosyltransferase 84B2-like [Tasmannia lanceolata]|uniref:UDP-glycosyltransferase 84B2-like n=1 Tax=Tasmannia lanceolata TaxID=3420 RepID=UPI004062B76A